MEQRALENSESYRKIRALPAKFARLCSSKKGSLFHNSINPLSLELVAISMYPGEKLRISRVVHLYEESIFSPWYILPAKGQKGAKSRAKKISFHRPQYCRIHVVRLWALVGEVSSNFVCRDFDRLEVLIFSASTFDRINHENSLHNFRGIYMFFFCIDDVLCHNSQLIFEGFI